MTEMTLEHDLGGLFELIHRQCFYRAAHQMCDWLFPMSAVLDLVDPFQKVSLGEDSYEFTRVSVRHNE
jgi:hypothetical protein